MEEQRTIGFLEKIRGWIANLGQTKDAGERVRLSRMAVKKERPTVEVGSSSRWNGQDDTDNYLLGHLLPKERHDHALDANKCAITHWKGIECLCPEDIQQVVEPATATYIRPHITHRDGCISSYIDETEPGMGMELDCLSCFLGIDEPEAVSKIESSKKSTDPRATVKDLPAVPPRLDFSPVDKNNRRRTNA